MNKQRLLDAANWAEKNIKQEMFDMDQFRDGGSFEPQCDAVGCMVGHLTAIDSVNVIENYRGNYIYFQRWSKDYFELTLDEWRYLFAGEWTIVDNTLEGAIERMRRLANGMTEDEIKLELLNIGL
jgi:hypothetical protein